MFSKARLSSVSFFVAQERPQQDPATPSKPSKAPNKACLRSFEEQMAVDGAAANEK